MREGCSEWLRRPSGDRSLFVQPGAICATGAPLLLSLLVSPGAAPKAQQAKQGATAAALEEKKPEENEVKMDAANEAPKAEAKKEAPKPEEKK